MGALRRDPRATETDPRKSGGRTRDSEGERGIVGTPCGREDNGRTEEDEGGENWRELDARKGKETEGNTSERGRRDPWRKLYRTVERNGENSQERKRRTRRGRRPPWREKMSEVRNHRARRRNPSGSGGVYPGKPGP